MSTQNALDTKPILHYATCPSCGEKTSFDLIGLQHWPERVVKSTGFPAIQTVWQCRNCNTTLMEPSLNIDQATS